MIRGNNGYLVLENFDLDKFLNEDQENSLMDIVQTIDTGRMIDGKVDDTKYIVLEQDAPYADEVIEVLKRHGHWKESKNETDRTIVENKFISASEFSNLVVSTDIPILDKLKAFENWQNKDGSKEDATKLLMRELFIKITQIVKQDENYVPREYQTVGGMWTVDTYKKGDVTVQLMDEGWTLRLASKDVNLTLSGSTFDINKGNLSDLEDLYKSIT